MLNWNDINELRKELDRLNNKKVKEWWDLKRIVEIRSIIKHHYAK